MEFINSNDGNSLYAVTQIKQMICKQIAFGKQFYVSLVGKTLIAATCYRSFPAGERWEVAETCFETLSLGEILAAKALVDLKQERKTANQFIC